MRPDLEMLCEWQEAEQSDSVYRLIQHCKSGKHNYTQRDNDNSIWNGKSHVDFASGLPVVSRQAAVSKANSHTASCPAGMEDSTSHEPAGYLLASFHLRD